MPSMIELIKELRDRTGAGMMDCKRALEANDSDVEKAIDWLREKGIAKAQAKASRIAAEGLAAVVVEGNKAIILEVNCETDFVAKGERFHKLTDDCAKDTLAKGYKSVEEAKEGVAQLFAEATVAMGEKLDYRRFEIVEKSAEQGFGSYIHMGGKIATLVVLAKEDAELAKGLAMHIAANAPKYIAQEDIPAEVIAHEKAIALENMKNDPKMAGKPEAMLTHHTYRVFGEDCLKHTWWFLMEDDAEESLVPQEEEDITQARWVEKERLPELLEGTYPSIREVFISAGLL